MSSDSEIKQSLSNLAAEDSAISSWIENAEEQISQWRGRQNEIRQKEMPELMDQIGMDSFTTSTGEVFTVATFISGSWPKDPSDAERATSLLEEYQASDLIKAHLSADFGRHEKELAERVADSIREHCDPSLRFTVHHAQLKSFAREMLRQGKPIDMEGLGLDSGRYIKVTKK